MKTKTVSPKLAALIVAKFIFSLNIVYARPNTYECPHGQTIVHSFNSSSRWDFCWKILEKEGLVLSDIHYKPVDRLRRRVLGEVSLSQIQTEYDDDSPSEFLLTNFGLGGTHIQTLTQDICKEGKLHSNAKSKNVVCELHQRAGYLYRHEGNTHRQGNKLTIFSTSTVGSREFIIRWVFFENGTIQSDIGIAGQFSNISENESTGWKVGAENKIVASFVDHFFWRLDFDIDTDNSNDIVEQIKSIPSQSRFRKTKERQIISSELAASFVPREKKFWRVRDGSIKNREEVDISYEMVMLNYGQQNTGNDDSPWLKNDIFITKYNECERFAVHNTQQAKKNFSSDCGDNVTEFVNAENTNVKDIVIWYRQVHHTLPSDEDFYPANIRWSSFKLLPRDWTSTNSL